MMVVFFGSFYLVNLMLAVVAMAYEQEADVEAKVIYSQGFQWFSTHGKLCIVLCHVINKLLAAKPVSVLV